MVRSRWALPGLLLLSPPALGAPEVTVSDPDVVGPRRATTQLYIHWQPRRTWPRRARVEEGAVIDVGARVDGSPCPGGWAEVGGGGYVCLGQTEPADEPPRMLPVVEPDRVLPFVYAHHPETPAFNYAYVALDRDDEGHPLLLRPDGERVDAQELELHVPSRFSGRDLTVEPAPEGTVLGWAVDQDAPVLESADSTSEVVHQLPRYAPLTLRAEPLDADGHVYAVVEGLPQGVEGVIDDRQGVHHYTPSEPPDDVEPDELWVDIELDQQVLALRRGETLEYVTLIAGGLPERPTPTGLFRIRSKRAHSTMRALVTSPDRYVVEEVPWTMYFYPHYALHGAYWHDELGRPRSHGCVNLAPLDAAHVYERVSPRVEPGFSRVYASRHDPGTTIRIRDRRKGDAPLRDRR